MDTPLSEWEKDCLVLLSGMPSGQEASWGKAQAQVYRVVLQALGEEASKYAVQQAILIEHWRPPPARLREIAELQYGTKRDASAVVTEIWEAIQQHGLCGVRDPRRPSTYLPGAPPLSEEARGTVAAMGGWVALCTMEAPDGVTQGHLRKAAEDVLRRQEMDQKRLVSLGNLLPAASGLQQIGKLVSAEEKQEEESAKVARLAAAKVVVDRALAGRKEKEPSVA